MTYLQAWQAFHRNVGELSAATLRDIAPQLDLGSDWGSNFSDHAWNKALASPAHLQALVYAAMTLRHGDDPTQGVRYV